MAGSNNISVSYIAHVRYAYQCYITRIASSLYHLSWIGIVLSPEWKLLSEYIYLECQLAIHIARLILHSYKHIAMSISISRYWQLLVHPLLHHGWTWEGSCITTNAPTRKWGGSGWGNFHLDNSQFTIQRQGAVYFVYIINAIGKRPLSWPQIIIHWQSPNLPPFLTTGVVLSGGAPTPAGTLMFTM